MLNLHGPSCPCPKCRPPVYNRGTPLPFRYEPTPWYKSGDLFVWVLILFIAAIGTGAAMYYIQDKDPGARRRAWLEREHAQEMQQAYDTEMARLKAQHDFNRDKGTL